MTPSWQNASESCNCADSLTTCYGGLERSGSIRHLTEKSTAVYHGTRIVVSKDPDVFGGALVFKGTRVPVQILIDYLTSGETLDRFLKGFPTVTCGQAERFLEQSVLTRSRMPDKPRRRFFLDENIDRLIVHIALIFKTNDKF